MRRQLTLFLPSPVNDVIDAVRRRWDPEMAARISPHVTLLHDVTDIDVRAASLDALVAPHPPVALHVLNVRTWEPPGFGIYLAVADVRRDIESLRRSLSVKEPDGLAYVAHVTIVHERTVRRARARDAWFELAGWTIDENVTVDAISLIESEVDGGVWRTLTTVPLRGS